MLRISLDQYRHPLHREEVVGMARESPIITAGRIADGTCVLQSETLQNCNPIRCHLHNHKLFGRVCQRTVCADIKESQAVWQTFLEMWSDEMTTAFQ